MMLSNFSSRCNLLCILVAHTVAAKMNKYSDENELSNFNENYFCEDVFDNQQCNYIRNVLRAIIELYQVNNSKQKSTPDEEQSHCAMEINKLLEEINKIKYELNTLSRTTDELLRNERCHCTKSKYAVNTANWHGISFKSDDTHGYKFSKNTDYYQYGGSVNQSKTRLIRGKLSNLRRPV